MDEKVEMNLRAQMYKELAQYVAPKKAIEVRVRRLVPYRSRFRGQNCNPSGDSQVTRQRPINYIDIISD
jgi:hypothetical protein